MTLSVMTVNLHCFQETDPFGKLELVAQEILRRGPDVITLQEAAQDRWAPVRFTVRPEVHLREGNAALWLVERLRREGLDYHGAWDWAHYGWDRWEEGCAVLSRHRFRRADSRYITASAHASAWKSRKPVAAFLEIPGFGPLVVFSCHLGWWGDADEPFEDMLDKLTTWQTEAVAAGTPLLTLGDFNVAAGTEGYGFLLDWTGWSDAWTLAHPEGTPGPTIGPRADGWEGSTEAQRIDYVFLRSEDGLAVVSMERLFTRPESRVSDHAGLFAVLRR